MREFKTTRPGGGTFDLDDPKTYEYLPNTIGELRDLMFRKIGYAVVYMDYFPDRKGLFPKRKKKDNYVKMSELFCDEKYGDKMVEINNVAYEQRQRIYTLIKNFANNERAHGYTEDENKAQENLMWYKEQVFLFEEEIENMC